MVESILSNETAVNVTFVFLRIPSTIAVQVLEEFDESLYTLDMKDGNSLLAFKLAVVKI